MNAAEVVLAGGAPGATALVAGDDTMTYAALRAASGRWGRLLAGRGLRPGDRVLLVMADRPDLIAAYLGAIRIGAVPAAVNSRWSADELAFAVSDSQARLLVADPAFEADAGEAAKAAGAGLVIADAEVCAGQPDMLDAVERDPEAAAFLIYSSGTTGRPKASIHRHRNVAIADRALREVFGLGARDRLYATSKMFFAYALGHCLFGALKLGASVVLHEDWPCPAAVAETLARQRPSVLLSVPTFYRDLLDGGVMTAEILSGLRLLLSAGERLPETLFERWHAETGQAIVEGMGASETLFLFLANRPDAPRAGCTGLPTPGSQLKLVGDNGAAADGAGRTGELWVKLESNASGYWRRPDKTLAAFDQGWFRSGDLMHRDADGYWHYQGRADDMLKLAGQWINPVEVESLAISELSGGEVAAVALADADGLPRLVLFVAGIAAPARAALQQRLEHAFARALPRFKRPREVRFVDRLPRTATGKVQRYRLREIATTT